MLILLKRHFVAIVVAVVEPLLIDYSKVELDLQVIAYSMKHQYHHHFLHYFDSTFAIVIVSS